jgi:hypothetical protein
MSRLTTPDAVERQPVPRGAWLTMEDVQDGIDDTSVGSA